MNNEQFLYWLQGMLEYTNIGSLSEADIRNKLQGIKDHLQLVFKKETPVQKPVEKIKGIEPDERLKKAWVDMIKKEEKSQRPDYNKRPPGPVPGYSPLPGADPNYWLEQPNWKYDPETWSQGRDFKPGTLYC